MPPCPPPSVSVLLPVYNGESYIESAVRSMMEQTLQNIEIVVIDDGSNDTTPVILTRLAKEDPRIRILRPEANLRLPRALNFGLEHVRGTYVARMDGDDLSEPRRLELQKRYLDDHPKVLMVGCGIQEIDAEGRPLKRKPAPADAFAVRWRLRFHLAFNHPTFMFRRTKMTLRYDPDWTVSEDYDFQVRATKLGDCVSMPEVLLRYRVHEGSITGTKWSRQIAEQMKIATHVQREQLSPAIFDALEPFRRTYYRQEQLDGADIASLFEGFRRMIAEDLAKAPKHEVWMRQQSAQLLFVALWRSGIGKKAAARAFLRSGRDFLAPLLLHRLANEGRLRLHSDPTP